MADDPLKSGAPKQPQGVPGGSRPMTEAVPGHGLRVAVSSSRGGLYTGWTWGLTSLIILAGGVTLHAARGPIGVALDRWLPRFERTAQAAAPEPPVVESVPEVGVEGVTEPEWTYVDIEAAIRPLAEGTEILIAEGRDELSQFSDLESADEARVLLIRNRWRLWGRIWLNRVDHVRGPLPPAEVCDIHAALEPTCRAVRESLSLLDRVPGVNRADEAIELLDSAAAILEQLRQSQTETDSLESEVPGE